MKSATALAAALLVVLPQLTAARTCWGYDGKSWVNNELCPGSQTCCGEHGICLPNKLCNSKKDGTGETIRGPCAVQPYDPEQCGEICLYDEIKEHFPRVTICEDDGKYCCDNDPDCCDEGRGVVLNGKGKVVKSTVPDSATTEGAPSIITDPSPSTMETSTKPSSSTPSTSDTTTTTPPVAAAESTGSTDHADSAAAKEAVASGTKIGLGVGIPVGVLAVAGLGAFLWFRRRGRRAYAGDNEYKPSPQGPALQGPAPAAAELPQELAATGVAPQEMHGYAKEQSNVPIELPADEGEMRTAKVDYKPYVRGE